MMEDYDFTLQITGRELEPYIKKGGTVRGVRTSSLADGEVGVIMYRDRALVRQYCEDSEGNIYLFTVNRAVNGDVTVPKGEPVYCFAKLDLPELPLPG